MKQRALTEAERLQWAALAHSLLLQAIAEMPDWGADKLVFHGGTSLHLNWSSPRHSEDLALSSALLVADEVERSR